MLPRGWRTRPPFGSKLPWVLVGVASLAFTMLVSKKHQAYARGAQNEHAKRNQLSALRRRWTESSRCGLHTADINVDSCTKNEDQARGCVSNV